MASAKDQQVIGTAGNADQDPACRTPLDLRLHHRIIGDDSPYCDERLPKTLARYVLPDLAQITSRWADSTITLRRRPGDNRDQQRLKGTGQNLRVAQRPQAAR
jgi:hypothetical protein